MSPIADLQLPDSQLPKGVTPQQARALCDQALDITHRELGIDTLDPDDREVRVGKGAKEATDGTVLAIELTAGVGTYEEGVDFRPNEEQISAAGTQIQELCKESGIPGLGTVIRVWDETAWMLRRKDAPDPVPTLTEDEMRRWGSAVRNPQIRLFLSPNAHLLSGEISSPEHMTESQKETEQFQRVTTEVATRFSKILGIPIDGIKTEVITTLDADADFSVEFDCRTEGEVLPEGVRDYLALTAEAVLNEDPLTRDGEAEVWIRQNRPYEREFE
ncbi:hypothetical protein JW710_00900 [Candidatus Dojkabacteria bacterium]|nr:hypothetical protein [Candidatus Dojkabacteria bacterium]